MNNTIITGIKNLQDRVSELEMDLDIATEQVAFFKKAASKAKILETRVKSLESEVLTLTVEREKVLKTL